MFLEFQVKNLAPKMYIKNFNQFFLNYWVQKCFVIFNPVPPAGAKELAEYILNILKEYDPDSNLVAQTYDGAELARCLGVHRVFRQGYVK